MGTKPMCAHRYQATGSGVGWGAIDAYKVVG
jgi:hypothetical protein